ncbi:MAG: CoA transferase [Dehalococcoidia bacterium]|nr:CoA transferase [Dehalococcoidia bacterium]
MSGDAAGSGGVSRRPAGEGAPVLALEGMRVLDHGHVWAGPLLGRSLAYAGAEVIKIEPPGRASGVVMGGAVARAEVADDDPRRYHDYDRGKYGITLDLATEEGHELYLRLLAMSDIVVENFSAGVMEGLGLGYEALSAANPGIILASLSATGATPGPWRDLRTYGPSLAALYGIKGLLGYLDDPQPREDTADLDPTAAGHAMVAILAALEYRERSGLGQHIDMAQGEATLQRIAEPVFDYLLNGRVAGPQQNRYPGFAPHGVYRASGEDRWLSIVVRDDTEWAALVAAAESTAPELAEPRFATLAGRLAEQDDLDAAIEEWTVQHDAFELTQRLQAARVAAFPVMGPPDLLADDNHEALRRSGVVIGPRAQITVDQLYYGIPWKLTGSTGVIQGPSPIKGGDNDYVFGELMGIDPAERDALRDRGVI